MPFKIYKGETVITEGESPLTITGIESDTDVTEGEYQAVRVEDDKESEKVDIPAFKTLSVEVRTETETIDIVPYETERVDTDELPVGEERTTQEGVDGYTTVTYEVTYHDGVEVDREETDREVTPPVNEIIEVGTYEEPEDPSEDEEDGD